MTININATQDTVNCVLCVNQDANARVMKQVGGANIRVPISLRYRFQANKNDTVYILLRSEGTNTANVRPLHYSFEAVYYG